MQEELTELCQEIHNWFDLKRLFGTFTIKASRIQGDLGLLNGQYFRIIGSVFNDGVHKFPADDLIDETFDGAVWTMAVPRSIVEFAEDIQAYNEKYSGVVYSPYSSESFKGYSYTKASGGSGSGASGGATGVTWKTVFADRLNRWRKI